MENLGIDEFCDRQENSPLLLKSKGLFSCFLWNFLGYLG